MKKVSWIVVIAGAVVGLAAVVLTHLGNPANMGFCIACFLRDITGAVGMHSAAKVQYVRPEIIGLVLGAFVMSVATKEFRAKAGSSPATRFVLGAFVMIGALAFLGCPLRMVLRIGGGDLNAMVGLVGFTLGIFIGIQFLKRGFSLKRAYPVGKGEGGVLPIVMTGLLILVIAVPSLFKFSEDGPGSKHAPMLAALLIAVVVGALAQRARLCMVGGIRDAMLFKDFKLLYGFVAIFVVVLAGSLITGSFKLGFELQPIAHSSQLWNLLGMVLVGWGSVLLGGCPLRTADELRRSLGAEHHGNVVILHDLSGLRVDIQLELALKRDILLNEEHTAESVGFLDDSDLMAALGSDQRRLHASDTAADNHDIPLMHGRCIIFALKLAPCGGIDRAAILSGGNKLAETGVTAQTLVDLIRLTHSRFVGQVRIGNNASADFDDVY